MSKQINCSVRRDSGWTDGVRTAAVLVLRGTGIVNGDCERGLTVGRDGCVNEKLLRVAEIHVQELHGENTLERDDQ